MTNNQKARKMYIALDIANMTNL